MQTKPFSQCASFGSFFGPVSPSSQSSLDSQVAVQSGPVICVLPVSAPGSKQMRLGHSRAGDDTVAIDPLVPPIGMVPSSQVRPMCLSSHAPPKPNIARANASSAKLRAVGEIEDIGEGNLMGTPWQVR